MGLGVGAAAVGGQITKATPPPVKSRKIEVVVLNDDNLIAQEILNRSANRTNKLPMTKQDFIKWNKTVPMNPTYIKYMESCRDKP